MNLPIQIHDTKFVEVNLHYQFIAVNEFKNTHIGLNQEEVDKLTHVSDEEFIFDNKNQIVSISGNTYNIPSFKLKFLNGTGLTKSNSQLDELKFLNGTGLTKSNSQLDELLADIEKVQNEESFKSKVEIHNYMLYGVQKVSAVVGVMITCYTGY
ncbi:hypothetical protein QE152_g7883 [Popillia japonica]|uniref:Uncharacterized protein n=1 Tax=Popillia japonica TaxID=7064 RepID=A0AAW1MDT7_POPJA